MIFPKFCNIRKGIILSDILLALSLGAFFTVLLSDISVESRYIFERAKVREQLMNVYENHNSEFTTSPFQNNNFIIASTTINAKGLWYGNDQVQTEVTLIDEDSNESEGILSPHISFININSILPITKTIGTPLCSVDFTNGMSTDSNIKPRITAITLPINPSLPLTDLQVRNNIAYISSDSTSSLDPDILIVDLHNKEIPVLRSTLNTGPGISAISLAGNRIFGAAASTQAQLHIIMLDDLDHLSLQKKYQLPLPSATTTAPFASSIFFYDNKIFLGTEKWGGNEFSIIDVRYPELPEIIGGLEISSKVNDIYVRNDKAYLADSDVGQLRILDISDVTHPFIINSFSSTGWQRQEGKTISYFEDVLGLGRTSGGFDIQSDPELFTWATTSTTTLAEFKSTNIPGGVYGIIKDRSHTYSVTREINKEFRIDNEYYPLPVDPQTLTCDGNKLYILAHSSPVIYEVTF
jgi:hypothetical protein